MLRSLQEQPKTSSKLSTVAADTISELILASYDVAEDDLRMRNALAASSDIGHSFDLLRKQYPERHEFSCYQIQWQSTVCKAAQPELRDQALKLGFANRSA